MSYPKYGNERHFEIETNKSVLRTICDRTTPDDIHDAMYKGTYKCNSLVSSVIYWFEIDEHQRQVNADIQTQEQNYRYM